MITDPARPIVPPWTPELLPKVQAGIEAYLEECRKVVTPEILEMGSGWSTLWFLSRSCNVTTYEHSADWAEMVWHAVKELVGEEAGIVTPFPDCRMTLTRPENFADMIRGSDRRFDLAYVDGYDEVRCMTGLAAWRKLKLAGILVLDDSHWEMLAPLDRWLVADNAFKTVVEGNHVRKTGEVKFHQTTIYATTPQPLEFFK